MCSSLATKLGRQTHQCDRQHQTDHQHSDVMHGRAGDREHIVQRHGDIGGGDMDDRHAARIVHGGAGAQRPWAAGRIRAAA